MTSSLVIIAHFRWWIPVRIERRRYRFGRAGCVCDVRTRLPVADQGHGLRHRYYPDSHCDGHVSRIYSDDADELIVAARYLSIAPEASQQGIPQTHGIIVWDAKDMLTGTRTVLVAAGLPEYA